MNEQETLRQMRDIRGLDSIFWWPPAPGWWVLAGISLLLLFAIAAYFQHWRRQRQRWHIAARKTLEQLEKQIGSEPTKKVLSELSVLLRRMAMMRHGRKSCAWLEGENWLMWLEAKDPKAFRWKTDGRALLDAPYAPAEYVHIEEQTLRRMIRAAKEWTL